MKVIKCDRCGQTEPEALMGEIRIDTITGRMEFDLCPKCLSKFSETLKSVCAMEDDNGEKE